MYIDMISYKLAEGITEEFLRSSAQDILELWMTKQEGFLGWDINRSEEGYIDFVFWENKECADKATVNMKNIPPNHDWMKCYNMSSIHSKKVENIFKFKTHDSY